MIAYYNENEPFAAAWLRNLIAGAHRAASRRRIAVAAGIVLPRVGQAVVCFLHTHPVQRLGVGRQGEASVANERMGDELRGHLPALGVALAGGCDASRHTP